MNIMDRLTNLYELFYKALVPDQRYLTYIEGLKITLIISFFAIIIGVIIGVIVAVIKVSTTNSKNPNILLRLLNKLCNMYIGVIRGTPVLLQLLIIANLVFTSRGTSEVFVAILCFGLNSGAYVAEIVRAGIVSIDRGQMEAGRSLGLNGMQTMRYIILPQAIKNILPALGNEFIVLVKETSVASVIAVTDLTQGAKYIGSRTMIIIPPLIIAAMIYLIIVGGLTKILGIFERRLAKSDSH